MLPRGLLTVAALLPCEWELRLVDLNCRRPTDDDWNWAEIVMLGGMLVQKDALLGLVREAKARGKTVVVGGPHVTSCPEEVREAGADFLVLGGAENTLGPFLQALAKGAKLPR